MRLTPISLGATGGIHASRRTEKTGRSGYVPHPRPSPVQPGGRHPPPCVAGGPEPQGAERTHLGSGGLGRRQHPAPGPHRPLGALRGGLPPGALRPVSQAVQPGPHRGPGQKAHDAGKRLPSGEERIGQRGAGRVPERSPPGLDRPPDQGQRLGLWRPCQRHGGGQSPGHFPRRPLGGRPPAGRSANRRR